MVAIIIDIECFHRKVIKELGVACGRFSKSYSFKPPYPYDKCTPVEKKINSIITKSCHLIGWNDTGSTQRRRRCRTCGGSPSAIWRETCRRTQNSLLDTSDYIQCKIIPNIIRWILRQQHPETSQSPTPTSLRSYQRPHPKSTSLKISFNLPCLSQRPGISQSISTTSSERP